MASVENEIETRQPAPDSSAAAPAAPAISGVARLFEKYAPAIRALLLRRLGNIDDAREGAQEVFLNLWRREQKGALDSDARAYLFTAAENWARDCRRKAVSHVVDKHEPLEEGHERLPSHAPGGEETVHWRRGLEMLMESVKELPPDTQRVFDLHHGSRMTYTEIAKVMGVAPRTVERHMAQAIAHCKLRLKAYL